MDVIDLLDRGTKWTADKVPAAAKRLDASTPCTEWDVRNLLDHLLDTAHYFTEVGHGKKPDMPSPNPPARIGKDPAAQYTEARDELVDAYRQPGAAERSGPSAGIAFVDQLVHGWDLARATEQDDAIPDDLAEAAVSLVDGRLGAEQRGKAFAPALPVGKDATPQQRLLAYMGRRA
jgi:uncharacterized protein (TIGR03086 family)